MSSTTDAADVASRGGADHGSELPGGAPPRHGVGVELPRHQLGREQHRVGAVRRLVGRIAEGDGGGEEAPRIVHGRGIVHADAYARANQHIIFGNYLSHILTESLGIVGPANIQCFREDDGTHFITDINTRFGGGFPLPLAAGGRYPELALALARGEHPEPRLGDFREGIVMTRFFSDLSLTPNGDGTLKPLAPTE